MMATTLDHGGETPPIIGKGHGTAALGPSDSSDSGSDIQGGPGLNRDDGLLNPTGTTSDPDVDGAFATAGPDIGDANLDSDSDRNGTGERAAAGRDSTLPVDVVLHDEAGRVVDGETIGDDESSGGGAARDELSGAGVERESIEADANVTAGESYRPAQAGQDALDGDVANRDGDAQSAAEPGECAYARAGGKHVTPRDSVPVFDRAARNDQPGHPRDSNGR